MELIIDGVNVFNPLEGKIDVLIDSFVEIYGEKHRELITEKINNAHLFFLPTNNFKKLDSIISTYFFTKYSNLNKQLINEFCENKERVAAFNTNNDVEKLISSMDGLYGNGYYSPYNLNAILQYLGVQPLNAPVLRQEDLQELLKNQEVNGMVTNFIEGLKQIYISSGCELLFEQFEQQKLEALSKIQTYDNNIENLEQLHSKQIYQLLSQYIMPILDNEEYEFNKENIVNNYKELLLLDLENEKDIMFLGNFKKKQYVELFNKFGFYLGDNFDDYIKNSELVNKVLNPEIKDQLNQLQQMQLFEKINNNEFFKNSVNIIEQLAPIDGTLEYVKNIYDFMKNDFGSCSAFITPVISRNDQYKLHTLVVCPCSILTSNDEDNTIIHELGHLIESSILTNNTNEECVNFASGFDGWEISKSGEDYNGKNLDFSETERKSRKYEKFNEIINDYFIHEVCMSLHAKGVRLNLGDQQDKLTTTYSYGLLLLEPFIQKYRQELIDARLSDEPFSFRNLIGEYNFDLLADVCTEYLEKTTSIGNHISFRKELKLAASNYNCSLREATQLDIPWSENAQEFLKCFKTVDNILSSSEETK